MSENKFAKIPVASHGVHKHSYNYPWLSSINFGDVMPCYYNPIRKGERDNPRAGMYSQLMPIAHNAFATGRYSFKGIFVPYKLVWRPWYAFDQQQEYVANKVRFRPERYPYVRMDKFSQAFVTAFSASDQSTASEDNYDVCLFNFSAGQVYPDNARFVLLSREGRRVLRVLGALGCMPSFDLSDDTSLNILSLMCYIKAFADYYFPNNYVGGTAWSILSNWFERDDVDFTSECGSLCSALELCTLNFYENSVFDLVWDNPVTPNVAASSPNVVISDVTDPNGDLGSAQVNTSSVDNGTPAVTDPSASGLNGFTQYILNALKSVSLWAKRRQLSGARLIDKFLVSRGVSLSNDSARMSYFLGERKVEIDVSAVENNTDTNLGELAGRGVASSGSQPIEFDCRPDDDGIFFVIVSAIPDANFPVLLDGFSVRQDFLQNYNAEYDKLGAAPVPSQLIFRFLNGYDNGRIGRETVYGFLNQYWDEIQEKPRLLGDFILKARGAEELQAYHTFRILSPGNSNIFDNPIHGLSFQRMIDSYQYQRLFYSSQQENLMLFLRWYGDQYKEKLPLGDSYDWDDDDLNRKVSIAIGGSQK